MVHKDVVFAENNAYRRMVTDSDEWIHRYNSSERIFLNIKMRYSPLIGALTLWIPVVPFLNMTDSPLGVLHYQTVDQQDGTIIGRMDKPVNAPGLRHNDKQRWFWNGHIGIGFDYQYLVFDMIDTYHVAGIKPGISRCSVDEHCWLIEDRDSPLRFAATFKPFPEELLLEINAILTIKDGAAESTINIVWDLGIGDDWIFNFTIKLSYQYAFFFDFSWVTLCKSGMARGMKGRTCLSKQDVIDQSFTIDPDNDIDVNNTAYIFVFGSIHENDIHFDDVQYGWLEAKTLRPYGIGLLEQLIIVPIDMFWKRFGNRLMAESIPIQTSFERLADIVELAEYMGPLYLLHSS